MKVHHRFLRRPYHIILESFNIGFYQTELNHELAFLKGSFINYEIIPPEKLEIHNAIEHDWVNKGFKEREQEIKLKYGRMPYIMHGKREKVCAVIELLLRQYESPDDTDLKEGEPTFSYAKFTQSILNNELSTPNKGKSGSYKFKDQHIDTDYEFVLAMYSLARKSIEYKPKRSFDDEIDLKWLDKLSELLKIEYNSQISEKKIEKDKSPYKELAEKSDRFWKSTIALKKLNHSRWICFQRTDGCNSHSEYSISVSPIEIKYHKDDRGMSAHMISQYINVKGDEETYKYNGIITYDNSTDYMIVELFRDIVENGTPPSVAYFIMHITNDRHQTLLMGHYVYYSLNSQRFITKSVIWIRVENQKILNLINKISGQAYSPEKFMTYAYDLNPMVHYEIFPEIPLNIRRYLADRNKNRLTLPEERLAHLDETDASLSKWMEKVNATAEDQRLKDIGGTYFILYYYGDEINDQTTNEQILQQVRADRLFLSYDDNYILYKAEYIHERTPQIIYSGTAARRKETVEILVEQERETKHKITNSNIVSINFTIPDVEELIFAEEFKKVKYMEGLINGLNDNELTPIAFIALITKAKFNEKDELEPPFNKHNLQLQSSTDVASFFRNNRKQLRIAPQPYYPLTSETVLILALQKGYGCYEDDGKLMVKDKDAKVHFDTKIINNLEFTILSHADTIKQLPNLRKQQN